MKRYLIKDRLLGYMYEEEDRIGGLSYSWDLDNYTVFFDSKEEAERNASSGDEIIEVEV